MVQFDSIYFKDRKSFTNWLQQNYQTSKGIWMIYYKKYTKKKCINYREALEEALCYGWIDSIIKRIDEERYVRKFSPRKDSKNWSELNKKIALDLIHNGRMTPAGLSKIDPSIQLEEKISKRNTVPSRSKRIIVPDYFLNELSKNDVSYRNFNKLAPSHKKNYILWISQAKREETRTKRIHETIQLLIKEKKLD